MGQYENEIELLQAAVKGERDAFGAVVEKYQSLICAITFSAVADLGKSEELAQETFVKAWQSIGRLRDLSKFRGWLCTIARNVINTFMKDQKQDVIGRAAPMDTIDSISSDGYRPYERIIREEQLMVMREALEHLPEDYREALVLFYRENQSGRQVAEQFDITEETARMRVHRGRALLREQVAKMIETTLERTKPGKAFTAAVMAGIAGIGVGASGAAGTALAGTGAGIGIGTVTTGAGGLTIMSGLTAKIVVAAVVVTVGAAAYVGYKKVGTGKVEGRPVVAEANIARSNVKEARKEIAAATTADNASETSKASVSTAVGMAASTKPKVRRPNWPAVNEPVTDVYAQVTDVTASGKKSIQKFWLKLPDKFRNEDDKEVIVNDGKKRLTLNLKTKKAQLEDEWIEGGKVFWAYMIPLAKHPILEECVRCFRDPNVPAGAIIEIEEDSTAQVQVYRIVERNRPDPNTVFIKAWVDRQSRLPERLEAASTCDPNGTGGVCRTSIVFDFSPISDNMFSINIPLGFGVLPEKMPKTLSGEVVDLNGREVAGAQIWLRDWTRPQLVGPVESDQFGQFILKLPPDREGLLYTACLWARMKNDPKWVGWTVLWGDKEPNSNRFDRGVGSMGRIRASEKYVNSKGQQGAWCESASDIVIVMEEGAKIHGWVRDSKGKGVGQASIEVRIQDLKSSKPGGRINTYYLCTENFWMTKTDGEGYYEIHDFPKLWSECVLFVVARPDQKSRLVGECRSIQRLGDTNEPQEASFELLEKGPTIRGVVKDNYGTPLSERWVNILLKDRQLNDYSVRTDAAGRFEFKGCPVIERIIIKAELSSLSISPHEKDKFENFVYYPDVMTEVAIEPAKDVYDVELTAIKPEIEIEAILTDSNGTLLPYFPVDIRADDVINSDWKSHRKLDGRTDANGVVRFVNVPEMKGLRLVCGGELSLFSDQSHSKEQRQILKSLEEEYRS